MFQCLGLSSRAVFMKISCTNKPIAGMPCAQIESMRNAHSLLPVTRGPLHFSHLSNGLWERARLLGKLWLLPYLREMSILCWAFSEVFHTRLFLGSLARRTVSLKYTSSQQNYVPQIQGLQTRWRTASLKLRDFRSTGGLCPSNFTTEVCLHSDFF